MLLGIRPSCNLGRTPLFSMLLGIRPSCNLGITPLVFPILLGIRPSFNLCITPQFGTHQGCCPIARHSLNKTLSHFLPSVKPIVVFVMACGPPPSSIPAEHITFYVLLGNRPSCNLCRTPLFSYVAGHPTLMQSM